jgi:hypothetical protein
MPQGRSSERRKNSAIKIGQAGCSVVHSSLCAKDVWNPAYHTVSVDRLCSYRDLEIKLMERESQKKKRKKKKKILGQPGLHSETVSKKQNKNINPSLLRIEPIWGELEQGVILYFCLKIIVGYLKDHRQLPISVYTFFSFTL